MARHPHIDVMVQGGGSGTGIAALLQGMVNVFGMASRELSDKEQQYAARQGLEVRTFDVALDGIAVVVHADNPVEALTLKQLREIFTGSLQSWQDVGSVPQVISVLSRMAGSGTAELFRQRVLGGADYRRTVQQMPTNEAIVTAVASQPWAIGYTGFGAVRVARGRVKRCRCKPVHKRHPLPPHLRRFEPRAILWRVCCICIQPRSQQGASRSSLTSAQSSGPGTGPESRVSCHRAVSRSLPVCRSLLWGRRWDWQWSRHVGVLWGLGVLLGGPVYASAPLPGWWWVPCMSPPFAIDTDDGSGVVSY